MNWKLTIVIGCYVIGAGFYAAWFAEGQKQLRPGRMVDLNSIKWIMMVGWAFLFIGTSVFTHLIADKIPMFMKGLKKSDSD
jgi:hypothetical protein